MATATDEVDFSASDLIGSAGVGGNGEKLVNTLTDYYPPELDAALNRRVNDELTAELDDKAWKSAAKIAGVPQVRSLKVRGGQSRHEDAWVTYAYFTARGEVMKGAFPYGDLGEDSSDDHVSQRDSLAGSNAARDHAAAQEKAAAAAPATVDANADPFQAMSEASASELV